VTDPPGHLDLDALADVLADERADAHLRSCRPCRDRLVELTAADASVSAALGALPAPAMPDGLSARLARAMQEERRRELATVRRLRRRPPTWLPAVAASVALVMAVGVGWSLLDLSEQGSQDAATSDAGGGQGTSSQPEAAAGLAVPSVAAPTDWADEASRTAALTRLLEPTGSSPTSPAAVPSGDGLERLRDPAALAACLTGLPGDGEDVLALDHASFAGAPALAVVQPDGPERVRVTVVGSGCSAVDPDVLLDTTLPRP
jgi:hypothetical protein